MKSDAALTGAWLAELAEIRDRAKRACAELNAMLADYRALRVIGLAIKEEAEQARQQLRFAVIHSQNKRKATAIGRSRRVGENVVNFHSGKLGEI